MNKRLNETLNKWGGVITNGTFIDCYNQTINKNLSGTITTRINESCNYFVAVEDKKQLRGGLIIKNNTKQGYLIAHEGDGIDISKRMIHHRGTVQKGLSLTIKTQIDVGVVVKDDR